MIGSFLTRGLTLMLGYLYPAYECYKSVEKNRPDLDNLRFWCEYWMIIAMVTVFESVGGDALISWLPLYGEAKLAFIVYLWYPSTMGTTYIYATFVKPFVAKYEEEIDGNLAELTTKVGDLAIVYWQRSSTFFHSRFFEWLQFLASQSARVPSAPAQNVHPPRTQQPRLQSSSTAHQPSAPPPPPPGYQAPPPGYPTAPYGPPPPGYPTVLQQQPGSYPGPGLTRSGGLRAANFSAAPQPPPAGYPRSRATSTDEDDEFELVDKAADTNGQQFPPNEPAGANTYLTRARQRALADRGRANSK